MSDWKHISTAPSNTIIETKIEDNLGTRNVQKLKKSGNLWWLPDGTMYVYYTPTHWKTCLR